MGSEKKMGSTRSTMSLATSRKWRLFSSGISARRALPELSNAPRWSPPLPTPLICGEKKYWSVWASQARASDPHWVELTSTFRSVQLANRLILHAVSCVPHTAACSPVCHPAQPNLLLLSLKSIAVLPFGSLCQDGIMLAVWLSGARRISLMPMGISPRCTMRQGNQSRNNLCELWRQ